MNNLIMTITGPSGSGKSTLEKMLKCKGMISLISTTTRQPRGGEVNGQSYYFITKDDFKRQREQGLFVEEVEFNGEFYGLYKSEVDKLKLLNSPAVIVVEPHGKGQIEAYARQTGLQCLRVFVDVDSQTQLERLLKRFASDFADIISHRTRVTFVPTNSLLRQTPSASQSQRRKRRFGYQMHTSERLACW